MRRLWTVQIRRHSLCTAGRLRRLNRRYPRLPLMLPKTGSMVLDAFGVELGVLGLGELAVHPFPRDGWIDRFAPDVGQHRLDPGVGNSEVVLGIAA